MAEIDYGLPDRRPQNEQITRQITVLEKSQPRAVREALLGDASALGRLRAIDNAIAALRAQLT